MLLFELSMLLSTNNPWWTVYGTSHLVSSTISTAHSGLLTSILCHNHEYNRVWRTLYLISWNTVPIYLQRKQVPTAIIELRTHEIVAGVESPWLRYMNIREHLFVNSRCTEIVALLVPNCSRIFQANAFKYIQKLMIRVYIIIHSVFHEVASNCSWDLPGAFFYL